MPLPPAAPVSVQARHPALAVAALGALALTVCGNGRYAPASRPHPKAQPAPAARANGFAVYEDQALTVDCATETWPANGAIETARLNETSEPRTADAYEDTAGGDFSIRDRFIYVLSDNAQIPDDMAQLTFEVDMAI